MSLTLGTGPLAATRAGTFDAATRLGEHPVYLETSPKRVRGLLGGETVVDSRSPRLLHEAGALPSWWFPVDDVRRELLAPTDRTRTDEGKGTLRLWDARLGKRLVPDAAYDVVPPAPGLPSLSGLVAVAFDALDRWLEEDEEVTGHPRDPYHRVDTRRASERVIVRVGGDVVAESTRPVKLFETGLPTRWYLPREDVRPDVLAPSLTRTVCPYKGIASYHSVTAGSTVAEDAAWYYPQPLGEALQVRDMLAFSGDAVQLLVDGTPVEA